MKGFWTVLMLVFSNVFMTFAWYGHLKLQEMKISTGWPLILIILFSWGIAFFEYCLTVPANRIGFMGNGGPFNSTQSDPGGYLPHHLHHHSHLPFQGPAHPVEPLCSVHLPGPCSFFRVFEIKIWRIRFFTYLCTPNRWVRITVSTRDSQSRNRSSILLPSTKRGDASLLFFCCIRRRWGG